MGAWQPARQEAQGGVRERRRGPQGDLDGLFAVVRETFGIDERYVHDPNDDLWLGGVGTAFSRAGALGTRTAWSWPVCDWSATLPTYGPTRRSFCSGSML
jgi:hypothetical protein